MFGCNSDRLLPEKYTVKFSFCPKSARKYWAIASVPRIGKNGKVNVPNVCLDCLDLIFVTFKPPASRSRTYSDCNPIRAFETFDICKRPISKLSSFWMFWYGRGCNWLGAIKGMALWSRGFSLGSLFSSLKWLDRNRKPRMKSLWRPRVSEAWEAFRYTGPTGQRPLGLTKGKWNASEPKVWPNWLLGNVWLPKFVFELHVACSK